ncbi:MAG: polysaccharide biosynthesis/export family protein [Bacteroidales bacterium]|nr:polysaccharide biosynthesis/export family protein [Bacteroidales bacterium]
MKTNRIILYFLLVLLAVSASSCVTPKSVRYLQDMPKDGLPLNKSLEATVAPFDDLRIYVLSSSAGKDDELLKPFNAVQSLGTGGTGANSRLSGYLVDAEGNIEFPVLGKLHVEGLTRLQLQDTIAAQLIRNGQLKDPLIIVRFLNFKVFFLSSSGGKVINVTDERCTFLEALAMAGGLDWYTRRDRIGVMREVEGKRVIHYLDPRSTDIFNDEFFVLQQNDIIFTEERPYKFFNANLNTVLGFISSITGLVTSAVSVITLYKLFENWTW